MITKSERDELRSLLKQRFKVLEADVAQRHKELLVEMEERIGTQHEDEAIRWAGVAHELLEAVNEANRRANDSVRALVGDAWSERWLVTVHDVDAIRRHVDSGGDRNQTRREGAAKIEALVKAALLELTRQRVDLLTELATGALESAEAKAFLARIPTVGALIPASRMPELEQRGES